LRSEGSKTLHQVILADGYLSHAKTELADVGRPGQHATQVRYGGYKTRVVVGNALLHEITAPEDDVREMYGGLVCAVVRRARRFRVDAENEWYNLFYFVFDAVGVIDQQMCADRACQHQRLDARGVPADAALFDFARQVRDEFLFPLVGQRRSLPPTE